MAIIEDKTIDNFYIFLVGCAGIKAYLSLCEVQVDGDLVAAQPGQVVMVGEFGFQLSQLLLGERRALFPGLAAGVHLKTGLLDIWSRWGRQKKKEIHFVLCGFVCSPHLPETITIKAGSG